VKQEALLIIGGSGGIGLALLDYLSSRTDYVCIPTFNKTKPMSDSFAWIQYDSNEAGSTRKLFKKITENYQIAFVIDASGSFFASKLQKSSADEIRNVISTNLVAPFILAKNSQEFMQINGKLIYLTSVVGTMQLTGTSVYAASKAGLERGVLALSPEFAQTGHGLCAIRLGYMNYGMTYKINEKVRSDILARLPGGRFTEIGVLGEKILEILGSESTSINGVLYEI
jgi:3-oxoacyl-[acyl-carrier protein] reductase